MEYNELVEKLAYEIVEESLGGESLEKEASSQAAWDAKRKAAKRLEKTRQSNDTLGKGLGKGVNKAMALKYGLPALGVAGVGGAGAYALSRKGKAQEKAAEYYEEAQLIKQAAEEAYLEAQALEEASIEAYEYLGE